MRSSHIFPPATRTLLLRLAWMFFVTFIVLTFGARTFAQSPQESPTTTTTTGAVERAKNQVEDVKANSTVRGRVVYDDTERPVRRARVSLLTQDGSGMPGAVMTDGRGEFGITNVPAGSYFVMVDALGIMTPISFVSLEQTAGDKFDVGEIGKYFTEVVVNGENSVSTKVRARRGGAISGKITYADGDPAIGVGIIITRKIDGKMARFITNLDPRMLFGIQTDDRGMFRMAGLPPGEYNLAAAEAVDHGDGKARPQGIMPFQSYGDSSLLVTYFPGTTKLDEATTIQVSAGQEHNELNISLIERALYKIAGTVLAKRDRKPLAQAQVMLTPSGEALSSSLFSEDGTTITADDSGRFGFNEIPDGEYTLTATWTSVPPSNEDIEDEEGNPAPPPAPLEQPRKLSRRQQVVKIDGSDQADVTIMLSDGATVSGTLSMDTAGPVPTGSSVTLEDINGESLTDIPGQVSADGRFSIDGLSPAAAFVLVDVIGTNEPYYIKAITNSSGGDLTREPLLIPEGADVSGVRIVMSADGGTINGRILSSQNSPVSGAHFVLVPVDPTRWRSRTAHLFIRSDSEGSYEVSGRPGDYFAIYMTSSETWRSVTEAWVRERSTGAQRVTLVAKQERKVDLIAPVQ